MSKLTWAASAGPLRVLALASLAACLPVIGHARAADCINGYRMLGNQVIVVCKQEFAPHSTVSFALERPGRIAAPPLTGSVPAARRSGSVMADSPQDCEPGLYWLMQRDDGNALMAC